MKYTIKGLKSFIGNEGHGYNVSLYRDGKKVAFVIDDASGGMVDFQWLDWKGGHSLEELTLLEFLKGKMSPPCFEGDTESQTTPEEFVGSLIDDQEIDKKLRALCRKHTLIRITRDPEDAYRVVKQPFTPAIRQALIESAARSNKEVIEFINETLAKKG